MIAAAPAGRHGSRQRAGRCRSLAWGLAACTLTFLPIGAPRTAHAAQQTGHPYAGHVGEAAQRFGIPVSWIWAVMHRESRGNARALSHAGAIGLMQIMPQTWAGLTARYGLGADPYAVGPNIHGGAAYLREMYDRYGDLPTALAAYNAGPGRVDQWRSGARSLPAETIAYVAAITGQSADSALAHPGAPSSPVSFPAPAPALPSWRAAALFSARIDAHGERKLLSPNPARDSVSNRPESVGAAGPVGPSPSPTAQPAADPAPSSLFIPLSGRSPK